MGGLKYKLCFPALENSIAEKTTPENCASTLPNGLSWTSKGKEAAMVVRTRKTVATETRATPAFGALWDFVKSCAARTTTFTDNHRIINPEYPRQLMNSECGDH